MVTNRKKILFLNYCPSPYRVDFFNELNKYCDLTVCYYYNDFEDRNWTINDKNHSYNWTILFSKGKYPIKGFWKIIRMLSNKKYDITILGYALPVEIFSILFLKLLNKKFVLNSDGGFINTGFFKTRLKKFFIKSADYWLSSGSNATRTLVHYGAKRDKIHEYHFTSIFKRELLKQPLKREEKIELRKNIGILPDKNIILTIGRYIPLKGFEYLIEAIHTLNRSDVVLYIVGDGPSRDVYEKLIREFDLREQVFLMGEQTKEKVLEYCKAADIFVLSTFTSDVWGLVLNEAIACGLPVIATERVGAAYDLVPENKNGFIIPPKDTVVLSKKIEVTLQPENLMRFSQKSLEIATNYTIEQMAIDHKNIFNCIQ